MPKEPFTHEQQERYNKMLNSAVAAKTELRKMLADNPNLPAWEVFAWVERHFEAASYTHLCKAMRDLLKERPS